jgi:hypothetical protein
MPSSQHDIACASYHFAIERSSNFRVSGGAEGHQIALAIPSGASAVLNPRIAQRSRIHCNPNPVGTAIA